MLCTLVVLEKRDVCLKGLVKSVQLNVLLLYLNLYTTSKISKTFFLPEACGINKVFMKKVFYLQYILFNTNSFSHIFQQ